MLESRNTEARSRQPTPTPVTSGMHIDSETYRLPDRSCVGEDDFIWWQASGSLAPGASYTFTPQKPSCGLRALMAHVNWSGSQLDLSTNFPVAPNSHIVAPPVGNTASVCMFPYTGITPPYVSYSFTITNVGTSTASNILMKGEDANDWTIHFYSQCMNADADHDGWNDSIEHTMQDVGRFMSTDYNNTLKGSQWLASHGSNIPDDEEDFYPPDFNDDNVVDQTDVNRIISYLGQGNGIGFYRLSPNRDAYYMGDQAFPWRRFDLDGDGYVTQKDVDMVQGSVGRPIPPATDIFAPTVHIQAPTNGSIFQYTSSTFVDTFASDNMSITKVETYVNGTKICTQDEPTGNNEPLYRCSWSIPRRRASYTIQVKAYDGAGHVSTDSVQVSTQ